MGTISWEHPQRMGMRRKPQQLAARAITDGRVCSVGVQNAPNKFDYTEIKIINWPCLMGSNGQGLNSSPSQSMEMMGFQQNTPDGAALLGDGWPEEWEEWNSPGWVGIFPVGPPKSPSNQSYPLE